MRRGLPLLLLLLAGAAIAAAPPGWTRQAPHIETRAGKRYAVAVGTAEGLSEPLARVAAEDRARAELLRFLGGLRPGARVEGELKGAMVVRTHKTRRGRLFVRLELELR